MFPLSADTGSPRGRAHLLHRFSSFGVLWIEAFLGASEAALLTRGLTEAGAGDQPGADRHSDSLYDLARASSIARTAELLLRGPVISLAVDVRVWGAEPGLQRDRTRYAPHFGDEAALTVMLVPSDAPAKRSIDFALGSHARGSSGAEEAVRFVGCAPEANDALIWDANCVRREVPRPESPSVRVVLFRYRASPDGRTLGRGLWA